MKNIKLLILLTLTLSANVKAISIKMAIFGVPGRSADVTNKVSLGASVNLNDLPDPAYGVQKSLYVLYDDLSYQIINAIYTNNSWLYMIPQASQIKSSATPTLAAPATVNVTCPSGQGYSQLQQKCIPLQPSCCKLHVSADWTNQGQEITKCTSNAQCRSHQCNTYAGACYGSTSDCNNCGGDVGFADGTGLPGSACISGTECISGNCKQITGGLTSSMKCA